MHREKRRLISHIASALLLSFHYYIENLLSTKLLACIMEIKYCVSVCVRVGFFFFLVGKVQELNFYYYIENLLKLCKLPDFSQQKEKADHVFSNVSEYNYKSKLLKAI